MEESIIRAENISKNYNNLTVLSDASLSIKKGEIVSIVGPSGAGKTTLLQILGTLEKPSSGKLFYNNVNTSEMKDSAFSKFRNKTIGFVFQSHQLLPEFTALENVCIPAFIGNLSKIKSEKRALELLSFLGLKDRSSHKPNELSGGEQQRVSVARALINEPLVVFADEPTGNLDSKNADQLHQLFFELREQFNQTFVIVTHNKELASMTDRKLKIQDGKLVE